MTEKIETLGSVGRAVLHGQTAPGSGIVPLHVSAVMFTMLILSGFSALPGATVYEAALSEVVRKRQFLPKTAIYLAISGDKYKTEQQLFRNFPDNVSPELVIEKAARGY